MRTHRAAGFTLLELLVVVGIVGLLAAAFLPDFDAARRAAYDIADEANLRQQYAWLSSYADRSHAGHLPLHGGHRFVLAPWIEHVVEPLPENLERYFAPGHRDNDAHYQELQRALAAGEPIWRDDTSLSSSDTDYAGRAQQHLATATAGGGEVWLADDNEDGWTMASGAIHYLCANGAVRTLSLQALGEQFQWGGKERVFAVGADSPHRDLQKLAK